MTMNNVKSLNFHEDKCLRPIQVECLSLLCAKQYRSCEILALFDISSNERQRRAQPETKNENSNSWERCRRSDLSLAISYEILGDCYYNTSCYHRAIYFYRHGSLRRHLSCSSNLSHYKLQLQKYIPTKKNNKRTYEIDMSTDFSKLHTNLDYFTVLSAGEANLRVKEARCLSCLDKNQDAIEILERMKGSKFLSIEVLMELGRLYFVSGQHSDSTRAFLKALTINPYAVEAVEMLAMLLADEEKVVTAIKKGFLNKQSVARSKCEGNDREDLNEMHSLLMPLADVVAALFQSNRNSFFSALNLMKKLDSLYPDNMFVLMKIAELQINCGNFADAERTFTHIRLIDKHQVEAMDQYAQLLQLRGAKAELNGLARELMELDDQRPQSWICLALYHQSRFDYEKALAFIDKAISLDQRYGFAHRLKGLILYHDGRPEHAITCFFTANDYGKREIANYEGIVYSYMLGEKYKEAIYTAKEAMSVSLKDPRAMTLVGVALAQAPGASPAMKEQAKRVLNNALVIEPCALRPLSALVDIHVGIGEYKLAAQLLNQALSITIKNGCYRDMFDMQSHQHEKSFATGNRDRLGTKLGYVYTLSENFSDALTSYHTALSLNPGNTEAQRGLERLEELMRSKDPERI